VLRQRHERHASLAVRLGRSGRVRVAQKGEHGQVDHIATVVEVRQRLALAGLRAQGRRARRRCSRSRLSRLTRGSRLSRSAAASTAFGQQSQHGDGWPGRLAHVAVHGNRPSSPSSVCCGSESTRSELTTATQCEPVEPRPAVGRLARLFFSSVFFVFLFVVVFLSRVRSPSSRHRATDQREGTARCAAVEVSEWLGASASTETEGARKEAVTAGRKDQRLPVRRLGPAAQRCGCCCLTRRATALLIAAVHLRHSPLTTTPRRTDSHAHQRRCCSIPVQQAESSD
jgi:hypothetical protein